MTTTAAIPGGRIHSLDALRGFALAAILLVHLPEYLIYDVYRVAPESPFFPSAFLQSIATPLADALFFLFAGKSYTMFALLFGVTFSIQYANRVKRGGDFKGRFAWRLLWLAGFGCINAIFFPGGDILVAFAIYGLILIPFRRCSTRVLVIVALTLLLQPIQIFYCAKAWLDPSWQAPSLVASVDYDGLRALLREGSFLKIIWPDLTTGQIGSLAWGVDAGRITQTPGLFLLGCALGRSRRFDIDDRNENCWIRILLAAMAVCLLLYVGKTADMFSAPARALMTAWYNLSFSAIWVSLFLLLYRSGQFRRLTAPLNFFGKMSLTNYIMQGVIGSFVFFPWGFNLLAVFEPAACVAIGLGLGLMQIAASRWWLSSHAQGPFEAAWHRLTWMQNPLRR